MFFHQLAAILHTVPGKVLCLGTVLVDSVLAFLAVEGGVSNNTLIIISVFSNLTVLVGVCVTGWFTRSAARISAARFELLKPLVELPAKVTKLAEGIDGVAHELKEATAEGSLAKVAAARAEAKLEERDAELDRQGAAAIAKQAEQPAPVIVANTKSDPANVKQAE